MNTNISRRSLLSGIAAAAVIPAVQVGAQSIFPADPSDTDGGHSFRRVNGDSMFTNAGLNAVNFGNTSFVGVQVVPQQSELQAVLDTERSHFDLIIEINGMRRIENPSVIGDTEGGSISLDPYARMATSELLWDGERMTHAARCLNIKTKINGEVVWRWQAGRLLSLTATQSGYERAGEALPTVSVGLVPCIYELVGEDQPHVFSVTTNEIELFYNRYAEGEPAFLVDADGNFRFPLASI